MNLELKFSLAPYFDEEKYAEQKALAIAIDDGYYHFVKISTNKIIIERDRKDDRLICGLKNVKIVYQLSQGCLIVLGHLQCSFKQPFGGQFFVTKVFQDLGADFNSIRGVECNICFTSSYPTSIENMQAFLSDTANSPDFLFNLSQFDEFMELFRFYKDISQELNNNVNYRIAEISDKYYFVPVNVKDIEVEEENSIVNNAGVIIGHSLETYKYRELTSEQQDKISEVFDISITGDVDTLKRVVSFKDNLYVSTYSAIDDDYKARDMEPFDPINMHLDEKGTSVIITGECKKHSGFQYLNLYDMGQKVKLESIDNSLRLINQGASGPAVDLLEYIIGSKRMPSDRTIMTSAKEKYANGLDESQKAAFLMATDGSPVSLIKGPPGTGKTYVINAIVQYITKELGEKVIISSQTHVAIDNVLDELMENYDLIIPNRITNRKNKYAGSEIDYTLYKTWGRYFPTHNRRASSSSLAEQIIKDAAKFNGEKKFKYSEMVDMSDYSVIGATTTTSAIGGAKGLELFKGYDWLIIDEVSKCPITEVLRYLPYVKRIIMVGDDYQLAPLLEFQKSDVEHLSSYNEEKFEKLKAMYENSVFAKTLTKAREAGRLVMLNNNYRSVQRVLGAYNVFYDGALINKRESVKPTKVEFDNKYGFNDKDVFFIDVQYGKEAREGTSRYNVEELKATAEILQDIMTTVKNPANVSVSAIFPYAAQIEKFQKQYLDLINKAKTYFKSFEIDTVDAFQGKETDIVLVNTVVTDATQGNFLKDFRRINVSMSRARDKLFIFGNPTTLSKIEMEISGGTKRRYFGDIIGDVRRYGKMIKYDEGVQYESSSEPKITII